MTDRYFREVTLEEIKYFAEQGYVSSENLENLLSDTVYSRERGISVSEKAGHLNLEEADGYIEIYGENLQIVEEDSSTFILADELSLSHLVGIHIQEQEGARDHFLEVANMLEPPHDEIRIRSYQPNNSG